MKNKIIKISFLFAVVFFIATPVFAGESGLVVDFESNPLFSEANFLPGSEIMRTVTVTNDTPGSQDIIVEAINTTNPDGLGDVLNMVIEEGEIELYSGTLADFFDAGEVSLSALSGGGGNTEYDFIVSFGESTDNNYQEKSLGFDILIGFEGDEGEGEFTTDEGESSGGGSGGGGGGGPLPGLTIRGNSVIATDIKETSVAISWYTSYSATSRVVYDTLPGQFDFGSLHNYGYIFSTPEYNTPANTNGVNQHTIVVTGLVPETAYYFRVISHASPDTVSYEYTFTTLVPGETRETEAGSPVQVDATVDPFSSLVLGQESVAAPKPSPEPQPEAGSHGAETPTTSLPSSLPDSKEVKGDTADNQNQLAALFFGISLSSWFFILLFLIVLIILYIILSYRRKNPQE